MSLSLTNIKIFCIALCGLAGCTYMTSTLSSNYDSRETYDNQEQTDTLQDIDPPLEPLAEANSNAILGPIIEADSDTFLEPSIEADTDAPLEPVIETDTKQYAYRPRQRERAPVGEIIVGNF